MVRSGVRRICSLATALLRRSRANVRAGVAVAALLTGAGPGLPQTVDCARLQAALEAARPSGSADGRQASYARAAQRQRFEIARTQDYARSIGCEDGGLGLFGDARPDQCDAIEARVAQMKDNLDEVEARRREAPSAGDRADLTARFNAACQPSGNPADLALNRDAGFLDPLGGSEDNLRGIPVDPGEISTVPLNGDISQQDAQERSGKALCVRTCDGGFFPMTDHASSRQLSGLDDLCKASCPNTEAHLYMTGPDGSLASATAADGTPYTSLAAAFAFEKKYTASCTCKPPGRTWVEALADAEKLLGPEAKGDITVTAKISDDMAKAAVTNGAKGRTSKRSRGVGRTLPDATAAERVQGAQAPTASSASAAGIEPVPSGASAAVSAGDGPTKDVQGRTGIRKTIRTIAP